MQCDLQLAFIYCIFQFQCDEKQDTDCKASLCACDIEFVNTIRQFQHKFDKGQNKKIHENTLMIRIFKGTLFKMDSIETNRVKFSQCQVDLLKNQIVVEMVKWHPQDSKKIQPVHSRV